MYVRLAVAWTDPAGAVHGAGDVVDIDLVTLAELEEQGVVDNGEEGVLGPEWTGPGEENDATEAWTGPGDEDTGDDDSQPDEEAAE